MCVVCECVCGGERTDKRVCVCVSMCVGGEGTEKGVCVCWWEENRVERNIYLKINTAPLNPIFIPFYICITKYLTTND